MGDLLPELVFLLKVFFFFSFNVQGRGFNVQIHYVEEPVADYVRAAVSTVLSIHDQVLRLAI